MIKAISAQDTFSLRQKILRPGQDPDRSHYPGDDEDSTAHWGAFIGDVLIGIVSVYRESVPHGGPGYRIRGMAVERQYRGLGVGRRLVQAVQRDLKSRASCACLWCNARTTACAFYRRLGFEAQGEEFDIAGIGPHRVMVFPI